MTRGQGSTTREDVVAPETNLLVEGREEREIGEGSGVRKGSGKLLPIQYEKLFDKGRGIQERTDCT